MEYICDRKCVFLWFFLSAIFDIMLIAGIIASAAGSKTLTGNTGACYFLAAIIGTIICTGLGIWACDRYEGGCKMCCHEGYHRIGEYSPSVLP